MREMTLVLQHPGTVGVMPTDTVYGLVARAVDRAAVGRLYNLKQTHQPGIVIANNIEQLVQLGLKRRYLKAVEQFWPSAISVVIPCGLELEYLHLGLSGLPLRLPADQSLSKLLTQTGPLLTSQACPKAQLPAGTIAQAKTYFSKSVDFYIYGGDLSSRQPSTIIRIVDDVIEVIRQGAVKVDETTGRYDKV